MFLHKAMYKLLELGVGRFVKSLTIGDAYKSQRKFIYAKREADIILERILAACPNLECFEFKSKQMRLNQADLYKLTPAAFKNYQK